MKKFLTLITLIVITVHCTKKVDYQKTIQEIETNKNQFDLDFGTRGKTYMFYNNSSHYFYFENDTIENIRIFKSKILEDYYNRKIEMYTI